MIQSTYDVYLEGRDLFYLRQDCNETEMGTRIFLHVIPASMSSLTGGSENGYQRLDFQFADKGRLIGEQCIARRILPDYPISQIVTGQWVPGQDPIWEGTYRYSSVEIGIDQGPTD